MDVRYHRFGTINRTVPRTTQPDCPVAVGAAEWGVDVQGCRPVGWCGRCGAEVFREGERFCPRCGNGQLTIDNVGDDAHIVPLVDVPNGGPMRASDHTEGGDCVERSQFTFYRSYYEALMDVEEEQRLVLLMAVIRYALDGLEPVELSGAARGMFRLIRPTLDSGRRKAAAGKNGAAVTNRMGSGKKEKENEKENEKELEIESEKENDSDSAFAAFWAAYPRKGEKKKAFSVWQKLRPDPAAVMAGLEKWKRSRQWQQEQGRFVPGAVKWLRGEYWLYPPEETRVPCGANGELGEAELEAIRKILEE